MKGYYDLKEAGKELDVSRQWVGQLIADRKIYPVERVGEGGKYLIPEETLARYKREREAKKQ